MIDSENKGSATLVKPASMNPVEEVPCEKIVDTETTGLSREVHCLFGLPVDNVTMLATKELIRKHAPLKQNFVLSTVNINWVVASFSDPQFHASILDSDLVTIDGKPLLWLAKLLGCPMRETVPGATLVHELLQDKTDRPLTIFLFGGEGRVAELAMEKINCYSGGLIAVGALNPGFGPVEELSDAKIISIINRTNPDILLVALGARKGMAWIEKNRDKLNAGVISHLGATINFLAGSVRRAPTFMQKGGLEWVWRIFQEPGLFSRYASDGFSMLRVIALGFAPWLRYRYLKWQNVQIFDEQKITRLERNSSVTVSFSDSSKLIENLPLLRLLSNLVNEQKEVILDFGNVNFIDSYSAGQLLLFEQKRKVSGLKTIFSSCNGNVINLFLLSNFRDIN